MTQYRNLWVGEEFNYDGTTYTKANKGRCFSIVKSTDGSRPQKVFRNLPKNRMVEPLCKRLNNGI